MNDAILGNYILHIQKCNIYNNFNYIMQNSILAFLN